MDETKSYCSMLKIDEDASEKMRLIFHEIIKKITDRKITSLTQVVTLVHDADLQELEKIALACKAGGWLGKEKYL